MEEVCSPLSHEILRFLLFDLRDSKRLEVAHLIRRNAKPLRLVLGGLREERTEV